MNKNKLYLGVISALLSTSAVANNAVLNVEGEIQINGKTVIDSNGSYVGSQSSTSSLKTINLDDYYAANGKYVYKTTYGYSEEDAFTCTETLVLTSTSESSEFICDGDSHPSKWIYTNNGDGTYTTVSESYWSSWDSDGNTDSGIETVEETFKYVELSDKASTLALGSSIATLYEDTLLATSSEYYQDEIDKPFFGTSNINFSAFLSTFSTTENTYSNCYLDSQEYNTFVVRCPALGYVKSYESDGFYTFSRELVSYEASESKIAKVSRSQQPRKLLNIVAEHYKKQALKNQ